MGVIPSSLILPSFNNALSSIQTSNQGGNEAVEVKEGSVDNIIEYNYIKGVDVKAKTVDSNSTSVQATQLFNGDPYSGGALLALQYECVWFMCRRCSLIKMCCRLYFRGSNATKACVVYS